MTGKDIRLKNITVINTGEEIPQNERDMMICESLYEMFLLLTASKQHESAVSA